MYREYYAKAIWYTVKNEHSNICYDYKPWQLQIHTTLTLIPYIIHTKLQTYHHPLSIVGLHRLSTNIHHFTPGSGSTDIISTKVLSRDHSASMQDTFRDILIIEALFIKDCGTELAASITVRMFHDLVPAWPLSSKLGSSAPHNWVFY